MLLHPPAAIPYRFRKRLSEKGKSTPADGNGAEAEADCPYNHFLKRKNQTVKPEQRIINAMANR